MNIFLEIACDSLQSALNAEAGGASRIELCDNLAQGGITPSIGKITLTKELLSIPVFILIRPRKGDFLYSDLEFRLMLENIEQAKKAGADGIVSGILLPDGSLDIARTKKLVEASQPLSFTFHRAFDMCSDAEKALEQLIELGVDTVLSSGQAKDVLAGKEALTKLVSQAANRIQIMAGGGLRAHNIAAVSETGVQAFHSSAKGDVKSKMLFRGHTPMGSESVEEEFEWKEVNSDLVNQLIRHANEGE